MLTTLIVVRFIVNVINYLIFVGCILYYFLSLKFHVNFNGSKNGEQRGSAQLSIALKCVLMLLSAFSWVFFRLDPDSVTIMSYPLQRIVSDLTHLIVWFTVMSIVYLEWNRSLPHHKFIRFSWGLAAVVEGFYAVTVIRRPNYLDVLPVSYKVGRSIIFALHLILMIYGILGAFPTLRKYFEADETKSERHKGKKQGEEEGGSDVRGALGLLWKHTVRLETGPWLFLGFIASVARGFLLQLIYQYYGRVFDSTDECNTNINNDKIVTHCDRSETVVAVTNLLAVFSGHAVAGGIASFFWGLASEKIVNGRDGLRNTLFKRMIKQEVAYHDELGTGKLVSRFASDAELVKAAFDKPIPIFFEATSMILVGIYYLFTTNWSITLYMFTIIPLTHAISYFQSEIFVLFEAKARSRVADVGSKVQDVFSKIQTILIYGKHNTEKFLFGRLINKIFRVLRTKSLMTGVFTSVSEYLAWGTVLMATFLGIEILTADKSNSFADYITYYLYSTNVVQAIVILIKMLPDLASMIGATSQVLAMIEREPKAPEATSSLIDLADLDVSLGSIEFKNIRFTYPVNKNPEQKNDEALCGISFKISPNKKVAFVGNSGAGKSTVYQLLARFYDPSHGTILIDGKDISRFNTKSIRSHMAMVRQDSDLFSATILENIVYSKLGDRDSSTTDRELIDEIIELLKYDNNLEPRLQTIIDEVMVAVKKANCVDFIKSEKDLLRELGEGGKGLSGGQKQRVTIARALYKNPKILLLDEVTSALDQVSEQVIQTALDELTANRTVLIIAHRLHTIQNSDMIVMMEKGSILDIGTHDHLMSHCPSYRKMVEAKDKGVEEEPKEQEEEIPEEYSLLMSKLRHLVEKDPELSAKYLEKIELLFPKLSEKPTSSILSNEEGRVVLGKVTFELDSVVGGSYQDYPSDFPSDRLEESELSEVDDHFDHKQVTLDEDEEFPVL
eukprot:TRINITY_DN1975_c0_g1_i2.p1 TRINITY_DN1975_c0_g1~~TRINITY_DN1975_c0_g1_i2.p1  ORF type:complete len:957 (-),score=208.19 TRINITY_DN1975_c0_g1_i2:858-3728(-)